MNEFAGIPENDAHEVAPSLTEHEKQYRNWAMALHFSQFATYAIPVAGIVAPIVIWQVKKDEFPEIDEHGRIVANWMISVLIYSLIGIVLTFLVVGIFVLMVLGVLCVVFPIVGGIKASSGEAWKYPGAITFFS